MCNYQDLKGIFNPLIKIKVNRNINKILKRKISRLNSFKNKRKDTPLYKFSDDN